jgi:hypothetical protein
MRAKLLLFGFVITSLISATCFAQISLPSAGIIEKISGNGVVGYSGDGGPALQASFGWLNGIAVDTSGNLFELDGSRIREISSSTGIVTTIASVTGAATGIALDASGNVFVSSQTTIRKITVPGGTITTIAGLDGHPGYSGDGGPAVQAQINGASKVAIDALGNVYFADGANHRVRKIAPNGQISTIAGTGERGFSGDEGPAESAQLNAPGDVVIGPDGNLFIEDSQNYRIRKVVVASGVISTIAGMGTLGFSGDGGPALSAQFGELKGIAADGQGNLYLADYNNNRVREIASATGIISTIAGNGTMGLSGDQGPAVSAELEAIYGIALDHLGYLYILNSGVGVTRAVGPGAAQAPSSYFVNLTSSDPKPRMGEYVTLTAKVLSNLGLPALSGRVTWFIESNKIGTSEVDGSGTATMVTELANAGDVTVAASYSGDLSGYATLALPVFGYRLSAPSNAMTATTGQSSQLTMNVDAFQGFTGQIDFGCEGLPGPGYCTFSTPTVYLSQTAANQVVTLTVHTQNPAVAKANSLAQSGLLFAGFAPLLLLCTRVKWTREHMCALTLVVLGFGLSAVLIGCGGSGPEASTSPSTPANGKNSLPAGSYTFTVDAASRNEIVKLPITAIVE